MKPIRRWLPALPVLAALAVFFPVVGFRFVRWDDGAVLLNNPFLHSGWTWRQLLTSGYPDTYSPLCWLSLYSLARIFGFQPATFHAAGLAAHAASTFLVFLLSRELYRAARPRDAEADRGAAAAFAAALFAVHPVQAEMVSGAAYLSDSPACALAFAALYFHCRGRRGAAFAAAAFAGLWRWQAAAIGPLAVILDRWPLRRRARAEEASLLAVSAAVVALHAWAKHRAAAYGTAAPRPGAAALGALHLASSWVWPGARLPVYIYSGAGGQAILFFAAFTALLVLLRRRFPAALAAWACFLVCVAPPLIFTGPLATFGHDRYLYLPSAGFAALCAAPLLSRNTAFVRAGFLAVLFCFGAAARREALAWRDSETLWRRAFAVDPSSPVFAYRLGETLLLDRGRIDEAIAYFKIERLKDPASAGRALGHAYDRRAAALLSAGRAREGVASLQEALRWDPGRPELVANLAAARNGILKTR